MYIKSSCLPSFSMLKTKGFPFNDMSSRVRGGGGANQAIRTGVAAAVVEAAAGFRHVAFIAAMHSADQKA